MTEPTTPNPIPLPRKRELIIEALCQHFARDDLGVEEFERRVDRAHRAMTLAELDGLVVDLPALPGAASAAETSTGAVVQRPARPVQHRRPRDLVLAAMSGAVRKGHWSPAASNLAVSIMGGVELDFRDVALPPGITEINVFTIMGGTEIIVPPGLAVEMSGIAIMGEFQYMDRPAPASDPDAPVLRIGGFAFMGGVELSERLPGESAKDARRRQREERRRQRT